VARLRPVRATTPHTRSRYRCRAARSPGRHVPRARRHRRGNAIYETPREDNNTRVTADGLAVVHPDLAADAVRLGADAVSGAPLAVSWDIRNAGTSALSGTWTDRVYLSRDGSVGTGDLLVLSRTITRTLAAGEGYTEDGSFVLPIEATGDYFVIVVTDAAGQVRELNAEANNVASAPLTVALAPYAQLAVSGVSAPTLSIGDPVAVTIGWTVTNVGNGAGQTARWTDTVVASTDAIAGNGDDIVLGRFVHDGALDVGQHYDRDETFLLAPRFQGRYTLFVRTDADGEVFENGFEADNAASSAMPFDVMTIPYADLVVENLVPATSGTSGRSLAIEWDVRNQGIGITNTVDWSDVVYLSASPDGSNPIALGSFSHIGFLAPDGTYHRSGVVTLPEGIAGTYYVVVQTGGPFEFVYTGNNRRVSGPIEVSLTPPPDLVVSDIVTPAVAPEGSAIDVSWTVVNQGGGEARGSWTDAVFLRKFGDTGPGTQIGTYVWEGPLQAGMSYTRREQIVLPSHTSDRYELIVRTDFANTVYEHTREDNNQSTDDTQVSVSVLPRPDLQVSWVGGPATMDAGGTGSIEFRVINQGPRATNVANWTDRVYLSLDDKVSTDDILVGSIQNGAALEPGEEYLSNTGTFQVPKRFRGTVYAIVVADQGGGVDEWPNDTNNTALLPIYVNPWPFSDLVVSEVRAPAQAFEGNEVEVRYTVTNLGSGETDRGTWTEQIWLTKDRNRPHPAQGDILLQSIVHNEGPLVRNAGYDRVVTVQLPDHVVSGTYYLTPWVDPYAQLFEDPLAINVNPDDPNEYNSSNYKARAIDVIGIPPIVLHPDLKVDQLDGREPGRHGLERHALLARQRVDLGVPDLRSHEVAAPRYRGARQRHTARQRRKLHGERRSHAAGRRRGAVLRLRVHRCGALQGSARYGR
jgi:subtilase family serine protease